MAPMRDDQPGDEQRTFSTIGANRRLLQDRKEADDRRKRGRCGRQQAGDTPLDRVILEEDVAIDKRRAASSSAITA